MIDSATRFRWRLIACCSLLVGLALTQSPGLLVPDTKLDLAIAPIDFLGRAAHLWDAEGAFGQLQNQAYGYLWPMGPFFALGSLLNLEGWVVQRLWLALVMCVAFVGTTKLARTMGVRSELAAIVAGFAFALSPRMLTTLGLSSIEMWPSAMAPWVLLPLVIGAERGSPRRAAALSGLAIAMVGGVNAAATSAVLPLGALWLLTRTPGPRRRQLMLWWPTFTLMATLWWLIPLFVLGTYSPPFLDFIESAGITTIPTNLADSLRGTSSWIPYIDGESRAGKDLVSIFALPLNSAVVLIAGVVGLSLRRTRHRLFLASGLGVGLFLVSMGHIGPVQGWFAPEIQALLDGVLAPLRNVHKFDVVVRLPLVLGLAWSLDALMERRRAADAPRSEQLNNLVLAGIVTFAVAAASFPAATGRITPSGGFAQVPNYWNEATNWLAEEEPSGVAQLLPGSMFGSYVWGNPRDEPMQALASTSWAVRNAVPLAPPGNIRMLDAIEDRMAQGVGSAGLAPYMRRAGISHLLVRNDLARSLDHPDPVLVHQALSQSPGIEQVATFGPVLGGNANLIGDLGRALINGGWQNDNASIEIYALTDPPDAAVAADVSPVVVGAPEDLLDLTDLGLLDQEPTTLASDLSEEDSTAPLILTDGYRFIRRNFGQMHDATSAVNTRAEAGLGDGGAATDYRFADPDRWATFAEYDGIEDVSASDSVSDLENQEGIRPGNLPFAALDGHRSTYWESDRLTDDGHWWQVDFKEKRPVGVVSLTAGPGVDQKVVVSTGSWTGDEVTLQPGIASRVSVPGSAESLRVTDVSDRTSTSMSLAEVTIPDLTPRRTLVLPEPPAGSPDPTAIVLRAALDGRTGCAEVDGDVRCVPGRQVTDEEPLGFSRRVTLERAATYEPEIVVRAVAGEAFNDLLLARQFAHISASTAGTPDVRASILSAVDGNDRTTWTASSGDIHPTIALRWLRAQRLTGLRFSVDPNTAARRPETLILTWPGGRREVTVAADGSAAFPAIRTEELSMTVGEAESVTSINFSGATSDVPVGITELSVTGAGALPLVFDRRTRVLPCGSGPELTVNGETIRTKVSASMAGLAEGRSARAEACGGADVALKAGANEIDVAASDVFTPGSLILSNEEGLVGSTRAVAVSEDGPGSRQFAPASGDTLLATHDNTNPGWQATQGSDVVESTTIDGWRLGWRTDGTDAPVETRFAPDRTYRFGLLAGVLALAALLLLLARGRRKGSAEPALGERGLPRLLLLALGLGGAAALAGPGGLVVGCVTVGFVLLTSRRSSDIPRYLLPALILPALGAYMFRPWGRGGPWAGNDSWPQLLVVAVVVGVWLMLAADSERPRRPLRRIAGISTRR